MDLVKFEGKWRIGIILVYFGMLILLNKNNVTLEDKLLFISIGSFLIPLTILTIYYITKIRVSVQSHYSELCRDKEQEIESLINKERKEKDIKKRVEYIGRISDLLDSIAGFQSNRLTKYVLFSLILIIASALISLISLEPYIKIPNWIITFTLLYAGIGYSVKALVDILISTKS